MNMTLAEALALAVLKGDKVAAYVLHDQITEERERANEPLDKGYREMARVPGITLGQDAYRWPEFQAFAKRLGILWNLDTISITIQMRLNELVEIKQEYRGIDRGEQPAAVDSTTAHNQEHRTLVPLPPDLEDAHED